MRVFLLGGTGALGGHATPALVEAGHEVTAVARTDAKAEVLRGHGATPVRVSMFDRPALAGAMDRHDVVVNLASALPSTWQFASRRAWRDNDRVRTEGSAAVVDAALDSGVSRVVQESVSMLYPDRGSAWTDESVPAEQFEISRANLAAEESAARFTRRGGDGVVLRFGLFIGPGARHAEEMVAFARRRVVPVIGRPEAYVSSIHLSDTATAVVAALDAPAGTYNVVDDEPLTKAAYADALASAVGTRPWVRAPGRAAHLLGDRVTSLTRSLRVSNHRMRSETGWAPRHPSAREAWAATVDALARRT